MSKFFNKVEKLFELKGLSEGKLGKEARGLFFLSGLMLFALFNPFFKKFDYGAGWPLVLLLGVLVLFLAGFELKKRRENSRSTRVEAISLGIFMLMVVVSFVFSSTRNTGLSEVVAFISAGSFYLIYAHQKIKWIDEFLKFVAYGVILACLIGLYYYIFQNEPRMFGPFYNILSDANRWPNAFALFLLLTWPVFLIKSVRKSRMMKFASIPLIITVLLLTYSRGAFIALIGQTVLLAIYYAWQRKFRVKHVAVIFSLMVILPGLFAGINYVRGLGQEVVNLDERVTFDNREQITSVQERIDFWTGSLKLIKEKPVFGWGPYGFSYAYNPIQKTLLGSSGHPHNIFLKIGVENGLIALGGFLVFLGAVCVAVLKRFTKLTKEKKDTVFFLGLGVLGAFAHSMIDYNFNFVVNLMTLFVFLALIRSLVIEKSVKIRQIDGVFVVSVLIAFLCIYEGVVLAGATLVDDGWNEYSLYPREYYVNEVHDAIKVRDYERGIEYADKQIALNPYDSQAWYLKGVIICNPDYSGEERACVETFENALELNPMNDLRLYRDYLGASLTYEIKGENFEMYFAKALENLEVYFDYVDKNVHFTAYTDNVTAAAELIGFLIPHVSAKEAQYLQEKGYEMVNRATELREKRKIQ